MKKVALYVRVSTQEQVNGYSIQEQTERLIKYCEAHDWKASQIYTDPGCSGGNLQRPALQNLLNDATKGKFSLVLVYKLDRLSRSQKDTMYLIEDVFLKNNIDFISMNENFDTSTPFGRAMIGILSVFAQLERDQIKERMGMGRDGRAKLGKWHGGGNVPIGYDFTDGMLSINPYEASQVKRIYDLFLQGHNLSSIARQMEGYTTKYGPYCVGNNTIALILRNPIYAGKIKTKEGYVKGLHEAIIDQDTFDQVQIGMLEISRSREGQVKNNHHGEYLLSGLLKCKLCGRNYVLTTQGTKKYSYKYYKCHNRAYAWRDKAVTQCLSPSFRKEELEVAIITEVRKLQTDPEYFQQVTASSGPSTDASVLKHRLQEIEKQIQRTIRLYSIGIIEESDIEKQLQQLYSERDKLTQDIERITAAHISKKSIQEALSLSNIDNLDDIAKRQLIRTLIDYIEIGNDKELYIHWKL